MVALTSNYVAVLETVFPSEEKLTKIEMKYSYAFSATLTTGAVVMPRGKLEEAEVWCCPLKGGVFNIFSNFDSRQFSSTKILIPSSDITSTTKINNVRKEREEGREVLHVQGKV